MPFDIDAIIDTFPHPTLTPIQGIPNFATIRELQVDLNAYAISIHSNLGDGLLGLLFLTVTPDTYAALSNTPFIPPQNPRPVPTIHTNATARHATDLQTTRTEDKGIFNQYIATDNALKQQVIQAVDNLYLKTLKNRITGYANVTTCQILDHLYSTYGTLTPQDLEFVDT